MEKKFLNLFLRFVVLIIAGMLFFRHTGAAQKKEWDQSIERIRKGVITVKARPGTKIHVEQLSHEFWFGCAISNGLFDGSFSSSDRLHYKQKFLENFNAAVTENAVKWGTMERTRGEVNYRIVDSMLAWTEAHGIPLRGHNIFWGIPKFVQPWVKELNDEELEHTLKNRAETLTSRYRGRFAEYDLNNEMIHGNYYEERLGAGITAKMAQWVKNGDPGAKLWLNDYDILTGIKLPGYMAQIRQLLNEGVPVAGIGVQGHLHADTYNREQLKNALDSLAEFNLPVRVTEFNMPGQRSVFHKDRTLVMTKKEEKQKAQELTDYYKQCFAHPVVEGILMWGFWAGANWIPASSLYRKDWSPTKSAEAYQNLIHKKWHTSKSGKTGPAGSFTTRAFYGTYRITAGKESRIVELKKDTGKIEIEL